MSNLDFSEEDQFDDSSAPENSSQPIISDANNEIEFTPDDDFLESDPIGVGLIPPSNIKEKRESTRGTLAIIFVIGFFLMLILGGLFAYFGDEPTNEKVNNLKDVLLAVSGVLSGPLGFIVGYYFRKQEEQS